MQTMHLNFSIAQAGAAPSIYNHICIYIYFLYCGGRVLWRVAPSTFAFEFGRTQMNSVGESAHMNTPLTCELRHLLWPQYGEVPYASGVAPSIFSGRYGQTACAPEGKAPQIHLCPP